LLSHLSEEACTGTLRAPSKALHRVSGASADVNPAGTRELEWMMTPTSW
jgi:hypothetical protein